jgi:hypothetical protein
MTSLLAFLALCLLARAIGRAIDRSHADEALRNGVALLAEQAPEREIADNLDI